VTTVTNLDAVFIDVYVISGWTVPRLSEYNDVFKEENLTKALLPAMPDNKLRLTQQHPLLVKIHLQNKTNPSGLN
jgi:hypothetical protein